MGLHAFSRTELLLGSENMEKLYGATVAVFGVGGVGSFTVEALARTGIGHFKLYDDDSVCLTNLNRQLHALRTTVGKSKVELMKERILAILPKAQVETFQTFVTAENAASLIGDDVDYIVDAIDTISAKIELAVIASQRGIPIISSMGMGNKLDPTQIRVANIHKTKVCPLARVMRDELRKRRIKRLKVVYSEEIPIKPREAEVTGCREGCICTNKDRTCTHRRHIPGSVSFLPSVAGLVMAGEVIKDLCGVKEQQGAPALVTT